MTVDDPVLPAAVHLTGPHAGDVLRPAVERAGGELLAQRAKSVHYRRGSSLVVQFRADVSWNGGPTRRETLLAVTTAAGPPEATVPIVADTPGGELVVGVWRWPFDPGLPALETAIGSSGRLLSDAGVVSPGTPARTEVVAYRPMERAVIRVRAGSDTWYLKLVPPAAAPLLVERMRLLRAHDVPVPAIIAADDDAGWLLLDELAGPTLRELVKADAPAWVDPAEVAELVRRIAEIRTSAPPALRSRIAEAPFHLSMLRLVMPEEAARLSRLIERFDVESERAQQRQRGFVHGDLHESQLVVTDGRISGLLDVDEAGVGDPIDDVAVPIGHLRSRAASAPNGGRVGAFVDELTTAFAVGHAPDDIAIGAAAVLAGLAASAFRSQRSDWRERAATGLDLVDRELASTQRGSS